jgi:hypothetical protein
MPVAPPKQNLGAHPRAVRKKPQPVALIDDPLLYRNEKAYREALFRDFVKFCREHGGFVVSQPWRSPATVLVPLGDGETSRLEIAARFAEQRVIRRGRDCWEQINKSNSVETWLAIGRALCIGKAWALRAANTNKAWGSAYSRLFGQWMAKHGFGAMNKHTRTWAIALYENAAAIERWRSSLSEKDRKRLRDPQSIVRKWRQSCMVCGNGHRCPADLKRYAVTAWKRFLIYVAALPPADQAAMWSMVSQARVTDAAA